MLVLSRKKDEKIIIGGLAGGGTIEIVVVEIRGDKTRLGIHAPDGITIDREEVWMAKQRDLANGGQNLAAG